MLRVAHYLNQFFGQIGGEEKAPVGVSFHEGAVGPGALLQEHLQGNGSVIQTLICGDNFFAGQPQEALDIMLERLRAVHADLLVAGPAFKAGRYGMACGRLCEEANQVRGIPTVTAMHQDNPAVEIFRTRTFIVAAGPTATTMTEDVRRMVALGLKLVRGGPLGPAREEGYLPRGIVRNGLAKTRAVDRAVEMLLQKLAGGPFQTEIAIPRYPPVTPSPPVKDLKHATIVLVTEGAIVPKGNPDRLEFWGATKFGAYRIEGLTDLDPEAFDCVHGGIDPTFAKADPDRILPLDVMRDLEREGRIGKLFPFFYATSGGGTPMGSAERFAQGIFADIKARGGADAAILTAT